MRVAGARIRATILALVVASLVVGLLPSMTVAHDPPGLGDFMRGLGQVESSDRYHVRNPSTGAYGKYQIMPANWPSWAAKYLGNRHARQTAANQERVARGKLTDLYGWLRSWRLVAYWWLTGRDGRDRAWTAYATRYVNRVLALSGAVDAAAAAAGRRVYVNEGSPGIEWTGRWVEARHSGYLGRAVRSSTADGATATFTFTGRSIEWFGPKGPTRGRAIVRIDGKAVRTVDLYARRFAPRRALFSMRWAEAGEHTIQIETERVAARPWVAIDAFVYGQ